MIEIEKNEIPAMNAKDRRALMIASILGGILAGDHSKYFFNPDLADSCAVDKAFEFADKIEYRLSNERPNP